MLAMLTSHSILVYKHGIHAQLLKYNGHVFGSWRLPLKLTFVAITGTTHLHLHVEALLM